jgi:hypothetical protein
MEIDCYSAGHYVISNRFMHEGYSLSGDAYIGITISIHSGYSGHQSRIFEIFPFRPDR